MAGLNPQLFQCLLAGFFAVKADSLAGKAPYLLCNCRRLCHTGIRSQVPAHNGNAAQCAEGLVNRPDYIVVAAGIQIDVIPYILTQCFSGTGQRIQIQILLQSLHHARHTAGFIKVLHIIGSRGGIHSGNTGNTVALTVELLDDSIRIHTQLICQGTQVQHCIGRASGSHQVTDRILDSRECNHICGADILLHQFHDFNSGELGAVEALSIHGRNAATVGKNHTQCFRRTAHGISSAVK